jgi:hypothetical protein
LERKNPLKIKIFTWLLENNAIPTKDNMIRRKWVGNPSCLFCNHNETANHLFFQCPVARCIWGLWLFALEQTLYLGTLNITKPGSRKISQMGRMSTTLGSRLSAGLYGNVETELPLMEEESNILLKFSYMHVLSCLIGQGYKRRKGKHRWLLAWRQRSSCLKVAGGSSQVYWVAQPAGVGWRANRRR